MRFLMQKYGSPHEDLVRVENQYQILTTTKACWRNSLLISLIKKGMGKIENFSYGKKSDQLHRAK